MEKGAKICAPKELAAAKANLDSARHEATENWETAQPYFVTADKSADAGPCQDEGVSTSCS